jgi:hypothetical protein
MSGQIGTNKHYLVILRCQKPRPMSPPAIFQTVSLGNRVNRDHLPLLLSGVTTYTLSPADK